MQEDEGNIFELIEEENYYNDLWLEERKKKMIKIDNEYFINANESCFTLEKKTTVKDINSKNYGKETNEIEGYYTSIDGALNGYLKTKMKKYVSSEKENTIKEAIKQLENLRIEVFKD